MKIIPRETRRLAFLAFLAWGDFQARSTFARSTVSEEKWGLRDLIKKGKKGYLERRYCIYCQYAPWRKKERKTTIKGNERKVIFKSSPF